MKKTRLFIATLSFTAAAGLLALSESGCSKSSAPETSAATSDVESTQSDAAPVASLAKSKSAVARTQPNGLPELDPAIVALVETNRSAIIEHRVYYVVNAEISPLEKAQALFLIYEDVNKDGKRKVAHSIVRYLDDDHYALIREQLMDPKQDPKVLSVFMTDTLKRKNGIKLPVILDLARFDGHPMQAEARQLLQLYLGGNFGTNWEQWQTTMVAWLDKNPN